MRSSAHWTRSARGIPSLALVVVVSSCERDHPVPTGPDDLVPASTSRMLFTSERDGNVDIYAMDPDGGGPRRLTSHIAVDQSADWSPDGSSIAFMSKRDGDYEIFSMSASGGDVRQLTTNTAHE